MAVVRTVIGKDEYGDWQCRFCGRYIRDNRALKRTYSGMYKLPVCTICNALEGLMGPEKGYLHKRRSIMEVLDPLAHKRRVIPLDHGMAMDENEHLYPDLPVYRVYVTSKGGLMVRQRGVKG